MPISKKDQANRIENQKRAQRKNVNMTNRMTLLLIIGMHTTLFMKRIIENCGAEIPWIVVPCDRKLYRNYFVAKTIVKQMQNLKLRLPQK